MAKVIVVITSRTEPGNSYYIREVAEMSDDLPAENLGEVLARAVNRAWKTGLDPVRDMNVSVHFR